MYSVTRYHDFSCGHRVVGHETGCKNLHGHNYRIYFTVAPIPHGLQNPIEKLDEVGRVIDFSVIKELGNWLEKNWDHRMILWEKDPLLPGLDWADLRESIVKIPFNPTAENIAQYLVEIVGPIVLPREVRLVKVVVEETRKCSATYEVNQ